MTNNVYGIYREIATERGKQLLKGWTREHDDTHANGELAVAAGCVAIQTALGYPPKHMFPWEDEQLALWADKSAREQLIIAAALIVAEIERLGRVSLPAGNCKS